jgi:hypothetical protein
MLNAQRFNFTEGFDTFRVADALPQLSITLTSSLTMEVRSPVKWVCIGEVFKTELKLAALQPESSLVLGVESSPITPLTMW